MINLGEQSITRSGDSVYIIAEIGQNHQGCIETAKRMISEAKKAGCDCVKFQKSCLSAKFTNDALSRPYDGVNSWGNSYGEHKRYLEFSEREFKDLQKFSKELSIDFTASAMDQVSLDFLDALSVPFVKIGSGDANNFPMMAKVAQLARPVVVSTGMQSMDTLDRIIETMRGANKSNFALLHCVSSYPTDASNCNLLMIPLLKRRFPDIVVGYSGHEAGSDYLITAAAVLLGARIVERHFTLDSTQKGSDHMCSLEPGELRKLINQIRQLKDSEFLKRSDYEISEIFDILGHEHHLRNALKQVEEKVILPCEEICKLKLGKSLVTSRPLYSGSVLQFEDICIKVSEPNGIPAEHIYEVIGAKLQASIEEDNPIKYTDLSLVK